jgi:hypothetical protein
VIYLRLKSNICIEPVLEIWTSGYPVPSALARDTSNLTSLHDLSIGALNFKIDSEKNPINHKTIIKIIIIVKIINKIEATVGDNAFLLILITSF